MAVSDRCANATPVTLNEIIMLFGHDSNLKSDDTFDLIILLAAFFLYTNEKSRKIYHSSICLNYISKPFLNQKKLRNIKYMIRFFLDFLQRFHGKLNYMLQMSDSANCTCTRTHG